MARKRILQRAFFLLCTGLLGLLGAAQYRKVLSLSAPPKRGGKGLIECLWKRHSTRRFFEEQLPEGALSRILWCADGVNRPDGKRTAPSAFASYPVNIYVVKKNSVFKFAPREQALVKVEPKLKSGEKDLRRVVAGPSGFAKAPVILVLTIVPGKLPKTAESELRIPWCHAECGAIGQNVYLACADLELGTVFAACMRPKVVSRLLNLKDGELPVYIMPIGKSLSPR